MIDCNNTFQEGMGKSRRTESGTPIFPSGNFYTVVEEDDCFSNYHLSLWMDTVDNIALDLDEIYMLVPGEAQITSPWDDDIIRMEV